MQAKAQGCKDVKGPCIRKHEHARDPKAGSEKQFLKKQGWGGGVARGAEASAPLDWILRTHMVERERELVHSCGLSPDAAHTSVHEPPPQ